MTDHGKKAEELFRCGYNCAQAVFAAFCDVTGMDERQALLLASSFGGGVARLREVCGAVSGMCMAAGLLYGYAEADAGEEKAAHYARIQALVGAFRAQFGSILCRELLKDTTTTPGTVPEARSPAFYHSRPCLRYCAEAARILDDYIVSNRNDLP